MRAMTMTPCDRIEAYGHEHAVQCLTDCALAIEGSKKRAYKRAIRECVDAMVETLGKAKPDCHFLLPSTATDDMGDRRNACAAECLEQAKPLVTRRRLRLHSVRPERITNVRVSRPSARRTRTSLRSDSASLQRDSRKRNVLRTLR